MLQEPRDRGPHAHAPDTKVKYKTNPPTSGNHDPIPAADGVYSRPTTAPTTRHFVHTLEHGRIEIQYDPTLPQARHRPARRPLQRGPVPHGAVPEPHACPTRSRSPPGGTCSGCKKVNDETFDAIRAFRDRYRDQGPEQVRLTAPAAAPATGATQPVIAVFAWATKRWRRRGDSAGRIAAASRPGRAGPCAGRPGALGEPLRRPTRSSSRPPCPTPDRVRACPRGRARGRRVRLSRRRAARQALQPRRPALAGRPHRRARVRVRRDARRLEPLGAVGADSDDAPDRGRRESAPRAAARLGPGLGGRGRRGAARADRRPACARPAPALREHHRHRDGDRCDEPARRGAQRGRVGRRRGAAAHDRAAGDRVARRSGAQRQCPPRARPRLRRGESRSSTTR